MRTWALVPAKSFERGKSRLADVLGPEERIGFARRLLEHVVEALHDSATVDVIAVVSDSSEVRDYAERLGTVPLSDDPGQRGLAHVVDTASAEVERRGASSVVICMSDLPWVSGRDIDEVVESLAACPAVFVPDETNRGTNALALCPPRCIRSCLGHENSLLLHRHEAQRLGLEHRVLTNAAIAFDVDDASDLERLLRERPDWIRGDGKSDAS